MILASDLIDGIKAQLDAVGSQRYDETRDYIPAINNAQRWLVSLFSFTFGLNKLPEESLRELIFTDVYLCNQFSRLNLYDAITTSETVLDTNHIWTILAVMPECAVTSGATGAAGPQFESKKTIEVYVGPGAGGIAERLTEEEWNQVSQSSNPDSKDDIFKSGSFNVTNGFKKYAYKSWNTYRPLDSTKTIQGQSLRTGPEIEIKPFISNKYVGVTYIKLPSKITSSTSQMEWPESVFNLLLTKSVDYITRRNYDREALFGVTQGEMQTLARLMAP